MALGRRRRAWYCECERSADLHVLQDSQGSNEEVLLGHIATQSLEGRRPRSSVHQHLAGQQAHILPPREHVQQRGLPRSTRAQNTQQLARRDPAGRLP